MEHDNESKIFDAIYKELRPSVVRLRNSYQQPSKYYSEEQLMGFDTKIIEEARSRLPAHLQPKVLMSSWTPPKEMKESGTENGQSPGTPYAEVKSVLKKNDQGGFIYKQFAKDYWHDALVKYDKMGLKPTWISIQNEPDYMVDNHPTCLFGESETYRIPSYYKAFDMVYDEINRSKDIVDPPEMIGPETTGYDRYLGQKYTGNPRMNAISAHLYTSDVTFSTKFFRNLGPDLREGRADADTNNVRKLFMTEFAPLELPRRGDPLRLANTIYKTLVEGNSNMYLHWDLAWGTRNGPNRLEEGSMLLVDPPSAFTGGSKSDWLYGPEGYKRTPSFYWYQHFTTFVRHGMIRVHANVSRGGSSVKALAFKGLDDNSTTLIMINRSKRPVSMTLPNLPQPDSGRPYRMYFSRLSGPFTDNGATVEGNSQITLEPQSITTIYSGNARDSI